MFQQIKYVINTSDKNDENVHSYSVMVDSVEEAEHFVKAYFNFNTVPSSIEAMIAKQGRAAFLFGNKQCVISKEML